MTVLSDKFLVVDQARAVVYATFYAILAIQYILDHQGEGLVLVWPL